MKKPNFLYLDRYVDNPDYLNEATRKKLASDLPKKLQASPELQDAFFDALSKKLQDAHVLQQWIRDGENDRAWEEVRKAAFNLRTALGSVSEEAVARLDARYGALLYGSEATRKNVTLPKRHLRDQTQFSEVLDRLWDDVEAVLATIDHTQKKELRLTPATKPALERQRRVIEVTASAYRKALGKWPGPRGRFKGFMGALFVHLKIGDPPGDDLMGSALERIRDLDTANEAGSPRGFDSRG